MQDIYILSLLSLLLLIVLVGVFYLYKQVNLLVSKVNKNTYDISLIQRDDSSGSDNNMFGNMDFMKNLMGGNMDESLDDDGVDDIVDADDCESLDNDDDRESLDNDDDRESLDDDDDHESLDDDDDHESLDDDDDHESLNDGTVEDVEDLDVEDLDVEDLDVEDLDVQEDIKVVDLASNDISIKSKVTKGKNVPVNPAKSFDVGFTQLSENDNNLYEVVSDKNGTKKWKKLKLDGK